MLCIVKKQECMKVIIKKSKSTWCYQKKVIIVRENGTLSRPEIQIKIVKKKLINHENSPWKGTVCSDKEGLCIAKREEIVREVVRGKMFTHLLPLSIFLFIGPCCLSAGLFNLYMHTWFVRFANTHLMMELFTFNSCFFVFHRHLLYMK